ncbi:putative HNH endonuclease [Serratia phage vB_SmaS_Opt-169]|nr:putative HNH endonuclease [Serratia phage vB_SmaS_Opt-169]
MAIQLMRIFQLPSLPKKSCRVVSCPNLATSANNGYCVEHKNKGWEDYQDSKFGEVRVYQTAEWKRARKICFNTYHGLCANSEKTHGIRRGNNCDHIIPLSQGGEPYSQSNLQMLCDECHNTKTAKEKAKSKSSKN